MSNLLIVEDEEVVGWLLREDFEELGFQVRLVTRADDALQQIAHTAFSAAVIDVGLPDLPGDTLAHRIRAACPRMPIVLATGMNSNQLEPQFHDDALVCVIEKPYETRSIVHCLDTLQRSAFVACSEIA